MSTHRCTYALILLCPMALAVLSGCASYATPGHAADMGLFGATSPQARESMTDAAVSAALKKQPLAQFPTGIAVVRVQAPRYRSETAEGWGSGNYSIVTTRDVEDPAQVQRIEKLPMVHGVAPINRLLLPACLKSDMELRQAAAQLHADMLLIYTLDTTFYQKEQAEPLTLISLGLAPNQKIRVVTTASAVLLDTRNGYVYGVAEATDRKEGHSSSWSDKSALDEFRRKTEAQAFEKLVGEFEKTWSGVIGTHAGVYRNTAATRPAGS